jgi:hypothetical protein
VPKYFSKIPKLYFNVSVGRRIRESEWGHLSSFTSFTRQKKIRSLRLSIVASRIHIKQTAKWTHIFPIQTYVTFVLFSPWTVNHYNLLVPTNAHNILIYISPHLAATCFGWPPSSGSSQPNSLKVTAIN